MYRNLLAMDAEEALRRGTRRVLINVGRSLNLTAVATILEDPVFPRPADHFRRPAIGPDLLTDQHRGGQFLINFGGLGQLINELTERYDLPGTYAAICFVIWSASAFSSSERSRADG